MGMSQNPESILFLRQAAKIHGVRPLELRPYWVLPKCLFHSFLISFSFSLIWVSISLSSLELNPLLTASSIFGSIQNFASPDGAYTWMCILLSSREKKKNR